MRDNHLVMRARGTVVSIVSSWHPTGTGTPSRRLRLLVEYDTDEGPAVVRSVTTDRPDLRVGSEVWLLRRPGGRVTVIFDDPVAARPWWASGEPTSGLLAYAGLMLLVLVLAAGIWFFVTSRADQILPKGPAPGSPTASPWTSPTPSGPAATPSASTSATP